MTNAPNNIHIESNHTTHRNGLEESQTSYNIIVKFSRFTTKEVDAKPKTPVETAQEIAEKPRTCSLLQTNKQEIQSDLVYNFAIELLFHLKNTAINPNNISTSSFIPLIEDSNFFTRVSPIINKLVKSIADNKLILNEVIDDIISTITDFDLNSSINSMCCSLLDSVKTYEQQKNQLGFFWGLNETEYDKYLQNIYKLFIEGDHLYPCYDDFNKNTNDLGPYIFENEESYMPRCLSALSYTIEELIIKNNPLDLQLIDEIMEIFGSSRKENGVSSYNSVFLKSNTTEFINLLSQGKITKYFLLGNTNKILELSTDIKTKIPESHNITKVCCDILSMENYINSRINNTTKIKLKQSEEDPDYYIVDTITETKNGATTIISSDDILEKQPCIFEIRYDIQQLNLIISFDKKYNKAEYINYLINIFNNEITQKQTDLEYTTSLIKLAGSLQRAHLYTDCNGRCYFFNIVIVGLMQRDLFPIKQPFNLWELIDAVSPEELAKKYLELCTKAPSIQPNNNYHWLNALPISEQLRIACITGNQTIIKKILDTAPELLLKPIQYSSTQVAKDPITIMEHFGHYALIQYAISHPRFTQQAKNTNLFGLISIYYSFCTIM